MTFKHKTNLFIYLCPPQNFPQNQQCLFLFSQIRSLASIFLSNVVLAKHCALSVVPLKNYFFSSCLFSLSSKPCAGQMNFPGTHLWFYLPPAQKTLALLPVLNKMEPKPSLALTSSFSKYIPPFSSQWFDSQFPDAPSVLQSLCLCSSVYPRKSFTPSCPSIQLLPNFNTRRNLTSLSMLESPLPPASSSSSYCLYRQFHINLTSSLWPFF